MGSNGYIALRELLFCLPPEVAHSLSLQGLNVIAHSRLPVFAPPPTVAPKQVMGITFPNQVGLAAGLDKNGDYLPGLANLGLGFIEVGTVTPKPQAGNDKPRLFRITRSDAIINRMGFNNKGVDHLASKLANYKFPGVIGVNIGKNKTTPIANAIDDYVYCFAKVYPFADYITVNVSSPNTPGLRELQFGERFDKLLQGLKDQQLILAQRHHKRVPIVVKIAPDLSFADLNLFAASCLRHEIDGIIATNTTIGRAGVEGQLHANEEGGLSGAPLTKMATTIVEHLRTIVGDSIAIIGVGGIMSASDAQAKITAGADLVQIYTGLIYYGPKLAKDIVAALHEEGNGTLNQS